MQLDEFAAPETTRAISSGNYLVVCYAQPGATLKSVDHRKLFHEVAKPIANLLERRVIDYVVLATPLNPHFNGAEIPESILEKDGLPPHLIAPSHLVLQSFSGRFVKSIIFQSDADARTHEELVARASTRVPKAATIVQTVGLGKKISACS